MKIKFVFIILSCLILKNSINFCAEVEYQILEQVEGKPHIGLEPSDQRMPDKADQLLHHQVHSVFIKITGDVTLLQEVTPFDENNAKFVNLKSFLDKNNTINFQQNKFVIRIAFNNIKSTLDKALMENFSLRKLEIFDLHYLPLDLFFKFEIDGNCLGSIKPKRKIDFQFSIIENQIQYVYDLDFNIKFSKSEDSIKRIISDRVRFHHLCCGDRYYYEGNNCCDCLCCIMTFGCCQTCPFKNGKCPTKSGKCVIL